MRAFRVNIMGTNNSYLITEKQKPIIEKVVTTRSERFIKIGDNLIMVSSIKGITDANVDLESCPDYFKKQVANEQKAEPVPAMLPFKKLPTKTIVVDREGKILSESIGRDDFIRLTREYPMEKVALATCHYEIAADGVREYYTKFDRIAVARIIVLDPDYPHCPRIVRIYKYGVRQEC